MLTIRGEQQSLLLEALLADFEVGMLAKLQSLYPAAVADLGEVGIQKLIRNAIKTGVAHGISTAGSMTQLVELIFQSGERFENSPDAEEAWALMRNPSLPGEIKIQVVREALTQRTAGRIVV